MGGRERKENCETFTFLRFESKTATLYLLGFSFNQNQSSATVSVSPGDNFFINMKATYESVLLEGPHVYVK